MASPGEPSTAGRRERIIVLLENYSDVESGLRDRKGDGAGRIVVKENNVGGFKSFFKIAANGVLQVGKGDGGNLITGPMARAGVEGALGGLEEQHIHN